jgi:hypothetical protein
MMMSGRVREDDWKKVESIDNRKYRKNEREREKK